jgi:hypothetical protein
MSLSDLLTISRFEPSFRTDRLNDLNVDKTILEALKSHQILISEYTEKWYCKNCIGFHYYKEFEAKLYKVCSNDKFVPLGREILDEDRKIWKIDFKKFKDLICKRNKLNSISESSPSDSLFIGKNQNTLVIYTTLPSCNFLELLKSINFILEREHESNYFLRVKNDQDNPLKLSEREKWKEKGICEIELESFIKDQFKLPIQTISKNGKLLISIKGQIISVNQEVSTLTKTHAKIAKQLIDKNGQQSANSKLHKTDHMRNYISEINTQLKKECKLEHYPFINKNNTSFLNTDYYFAK